MMSGPFIWEVKNLDFDTILEKLKNKDDLQSNPFSNIPNNQIRKALELLNHELAEEITPNPQKE